VAQHDDLKLSLTATADKHANENAQEPVEQRHQHEAQSEPAPPRSPVDPSPAESTFFTPQAGRSEQGSVGGRVLRPLSTAPEDRQLVAQDDDLELPLTAAVGEHANEPAEKPVEQTDQHDAQFEPLRRRSRTRPSPPRGRIEFLYPTGCG
jgi:hypothetical protein